MNVHTIEDLIVAQGDIAGSNCDLRQSSRIGSCGLCAVEAQVTNCNVVTARVGYKTSSQHCRIAIVYTSYKGVYYYPVQL